MLSLDFLAACHSNMYRYLLQFFKYDNHLACLLLFNEYQYKHVGWFTGKEYQIPLSDAILFQENKMVDNIFKKKVSSCFVVFLFVVVVIDFF